MKLLIGVTGASGSIYAQRLLLRLQQKIDEITVHLVLSETALKVWEYELGEKSYLSFPFVTYSPLDIFAAPASGSSHFDGMIICPCSMGSMARIAHGISNDLITRSADVILKERKKLIMVTRETPLNLIHIQNMKLITEAGGIILPASPSFYSIPKTIDDCIDTVIDKVFSLMNIPSKGFEWGV